MRKFVLALLSIDLSAAVSGVRLEIIDSFRGPGTTYGAANSNHKAGHAIDFHLWPREGSGGNLTYTLIPTPYGFPAPKHGTIRLTGVSSTAGAANEKSANSFNW